MEKSLVCPVEMHIQSLREEIKIACARVLHYYCADKLQAKEVLICGFTISTRI